MAIEAGAGSAHDTVFRTQVEVGKRSLRQLLDRAEAAGLEYSSVLVVIAQMASVVIKTNELMSEGRASADEQVRHLKAMVLEYLVMAGDSSSPLRAGAH